MLTFIVTIACEAAAQSLRTAPPVNGDGEATRDEATAFVIPDDPAFLNNGVYEEKSAKRAAGYSLLLPGLGQWYAGDYTEAKVFFAVEGAIWVSFAVFLIQGYVREEDYKEYATVFAGVGSTDHSDDYYSIIGEHNSWIPYEASVKSDGRFEYYPNVDAQTLEDYWVENRVSDYEPWVWQSADVRRNFRDQRSASRLSYRRAEYMLAAALFNRVASAFFAIRSAKQANKAGDAGQPVQTGYRIEIGAPWEPPSAGFRTGVSFVKSF